jgi:pyruvate formate-lyase activating enzyme-like uncharacterized protein
MMKKIKRITQNTIAEYELILEDGQYTVSITEYDNFGNKKDYAAAKNYTSIKAKGEEALMLLYKGRVSACTLCDIIYDLMC